MNQDVQRELIRGSGLFDPDFYRRSYGEALPSGSDPLDHFLATGLDQGYLPSAKFDPVLYRVSTPGCGDANPMLHAIRSNGRFEQPPLQSVFPEAAQRITKGYATGNLQRPPNRAYAGRAADERRIPFAVDGLAYEMVVPNPEAFLQRVRDDRPIAVVRLPEDFWEALWNVRGVEGALAEDTRTRGLTSPQLRALATRICAAVLPENGAFAPSFLDEALADIPRHAGHPDFLRCVAFKGYPTHDESAIGRRNFPPRVELMRMFAEHFRPGEMIYDGTLWKRLAIAGQLKVLPELCRGRPVVLVGPSMFATLGERWRLDDYTHIEIPFILTQYQRHDLLSRTRKAVESACRRAGHPPVVLTQCAATLADWLITRLFSSLPPVLYLDLGQALNAWFFDQCSFRGSPWMTIYARRVIANCELKPFYRAILGDRYEEWFAALP